MREPIDVENDPEGLYVQAGYVRKTLAAGVREVHRVPGDLKDRLVVMFRGEGWAVEEEPTFPNHPELQAHQQTFTLRFRGYKRPTDA